MFIFILILLFLAADFLYFNWLSKQPNFIIGKNAFGKFTPGAIISEIRGKVASTVYSKNKGGAILRNRVTPINRRSTTQTNIRQQLAAVAADWRGLTQAERDSWNSASANFPQTDNLGQTIYLSGAQLYSRCNQNLLQISQAAITTAPAPTSFAVLALTSLTAAAGAGTMSLAFTPTVPAGFTMVVRATRPVSAGKAFMPRSAYRFIQNVAAAAMSPQSIAAAYVAIFGAITGAANQKIFVEIFLVENASGLAGQSVTNFDIVAA